MSRTGHLRMRRRPFLYEKLWDLYEEGTPSAFIPFPLHYQIKEKCLSCQSRSSRSGASWRNGESPATEIFHRLTKKRGEPSGGPDPKRRYKSSLQTSEDRILHHGGKLFGEQNEIIDLTGLSFTPDRAGQAADSVR